MEEGSPFSINIVTLAIYLRFTHAISYRRLTRLFLNLYALQISEGALDAMFQRAKPCFDNDRGDPRPAAPFADRLSDETSVRINGQTHWNWVFQNDQVVIHVVRNSRAASVVTDTMAGHRPSIWVSDLYGAQQGHADLWQVCLAHQLRDCQYAIEAGDTIFAPRMKMLLLRAVVLARRRKNLAESTRRTYLRRLDREMAAIMGLAPTNRHGKRLRKRYGKVRNELFTFLEHPDVPPDNNGSERELRPTATYRKVTGGFRSNGALICSPTFDPLSAPQHDAVPMRIRQFLLSWTANLSFSRVEQIPIVSLATAATSRCYPHPMGRRRAKSPFEDNPVIDGFLEWMDAPEGQQSIEALDLVFDALQHAGVDARQRKIVWADGKRLSIEQSAERIHAGHPDVACDVIETHVLGWLESCTPEAYSERQLEELDRLIEPWLDDYERTSRAVRK